MRQRNPGGVLVLVVVVVAALALVATFSIGRAYRSLSDPTIGLPDRPAFVSAPDPVLRAEAALDPNSTDVAPGTSRPDLRTVLVYTDVIKLIQDGLLTRSIPLPEPVTTPDQIAALVNDENWIRKPIPTEVLINAALVMEPGTVFTAAAPLQRIVLEARPGVFLGGSEAALTFDGVDVEASDRAVPKDGEVGPGSRPFVIAEGGRMTIKNSVFRYLGRDWNDSYGVAWTKGATGSSTDSTFERCFMGVFAVKAIDMKFSRNVFRDNVLYGINAHQLSAGVAIDSNLAEGNGRDGILLSDHVANGVVRNNIARSNRGSGIKLDDSSDLNVVSGNVIADNYADGVTASNSGQNKIIDNRIYNNRVAVGVYGSGVTNTTAEGNTVDGNGLATQGIEATGNVVLSNGDYWRPWALAIIWGAAALLAWGLCRLTRWCQRDRDNAIARSNSERLPLGVGGAT